jgi:putative ABC transport system permease protein
VLALAAGAGGLAAGVWASRAAQAAIASTGLPMRLDFGLDGRVFAFAFACVLAVALGVGLAPALRASAARSALQPAGRRVTAGRHPLRTALVVGELSAALMLLILAGLFVRSLGRVQSVNLGFNPHHLVNLTVDPVEIGFHRTQGLKFYHALLARVRAAPGVEAAALSSAVPLGYYANNDYLHIAGYTNPPGRGLPLVFYSVISPGYFHTLQIPIVRGRAFTSQDARGAAWVAIVNQAFAAKYWPGRDPIGQSFAKVSGAVNPRYRVVGVAANSRFLSLTGPHRPRFFLPLAQNYPLATQQTLQVRTALPPELAIGQLVRTVHALQPGLPVFDTGTMSRGLDTLQGYLLFRVGAGAAAALGGLGLILAVVGIYGVVSYSVSQRRHEVGVRMALGAQPADIVRLLLRQGIAIVAVGTALGVPAAYALSRYAAALLVGVGRTDLAVYVGVTAALAAVALLASLVPAARATADPLTALRRD